MRALMQRVHWAEVEVAGKTVGQIKAGVLVYVGVAGGDDVAIARRLADRVATMRIFEDDDAKMNRSCVDIGGGVLVIPNFTLMADTRKGRRPSFGPAAPPAEAERLYEAFVDALVSRCETVARGVFQATMTIRSAAAGPVNLIVETPAG